MKCIIKLILTKIMTPRIYFRNKVSFSKANNFNNNNNKIIIYNSLMKWIK